MQLILDGSNGSVSSKRDTIIYLGQDGSSLMIANFLNDTSPILINNIVLEFNITRSDGQQTGWQPLIKKSGYVEWYYALQEWDTAVYGNFNVVVRWYDKSLLEVDRVYTTTEKVWFIVKEGTIAQPAPLSVENYNILMQYIPDLQQYKFDAIDVSDVQYIPPYITYSLDGEKTNNVFYLNYSHSVTDSLGNTETKTGSLFVARNNNIQSEFFYIEDYILSRILDLDNLEYVEFYKTSVAEVNQILQDYTFSKSEIVTNYVNKNANETINGTKTFTDDIVGNITGAAGTSTFSNTTYNYSLQTGNIKDKFNTIDTLLVNITNGTTEIAKALESKNYNTSNGTIKEMFDSINQSLTELNNLVSALYGGVVYIGTITETTDLVTPTILDNFVIAQGYTSTQKGYTIYDANQHEWYYNGTLWIDNGIFVNTPATDTQIGVVKGNEYISIVNGLMTVLKSLDSDKLGGQLPSYYATVDALNTLSSNITTTLSNKVDKVTGKDLSTNDYTDIDKSNVASNTTARHTHSNKALLDTYTQTETDLAGAVTDKHTHSNKTILDNTTASYTTEEQTKLTSLDANSITDVKVDGTSVVTNKVAEITMPTSLPASDVSAWAKQPAKPTYTYIEVGAEQSGSVATHNSSGTAHSDIRNLINNSIVSITLEETTGVFTILKQDGTTTLLDTKLEKVVINFTYDSVNKELVLTLEDATELRIPMTAFIDDYTGVDGTEITISIDANNFITAVLKNGTIAKARLVQTLQDEISANTTARHTHSNKTVLDNTTVPFTEGASNMINLADQHMSNYNNPHIVTKDQVGLGNLTNNLQATKVEFDAYVTSNNQALADKIQEVSSAPATPTTGILYVIPEVV